MRQRVDDSEFDDLYLNEAGELCDDWEVGSADGVDFIRC